MSKQEFFRQKYKKENPNWTNSLEWYIELINQRVNNNTKILDIGCGHTDFLEHVYKKTAHTFGIDPDKEALEKNNLIKNKFVSKAEILSFEDNTFDIVVSAWVIEHLGDPEKVFKEISRVLKPSGEFVFITPNKWHYVSLINQLIPNFLHDFFTTRLYGRKENDTYPVTYRANSKGKIIRLAKETGFSKTNLIFNTDPSYISFNPLLYSISKVIERIYATKILERFRVHIIGILKK